MTEMRAGRHLCSQMVTLISDAGSQVVNMEEIWMGGAVLDCEAIVEHGVRAEIRWDRAVFAGRISRVNSHEFGWSVEIEFSPLTPWSPERVMPAHCLEI